MNWTDLEKEKLIRSIASMEGKYVFSTIDKQKNTYFEDYMEGSCAITEYVFNSLPELMALLKSEKLMIQSEDLDRICAIIAYKYKNDNTEEMTNNPREKMNNNSENEYIPTYIYNF